MRIKILSVVVLIFLLSGLSGCANIPSEHTGAATGAGIGAATGAAAGAIFGKEGSKTSAAVWGGLVGGLIGGAVGHYSYDVKKNQAETAKSYNYQPSMGTVLRIENVTATPETVNAGTPVDLKMTYAVLTPSVETETNVTETREIRYQGELVGRPEVNVTRRGGTYTSSIPLLLPSTAKKGRYNVLTTVQAQNVKDSRETSFSVQ